MGLYDNGWSSNGPAQGAPATYEEDQARKAKAAMDAQGGRATSDYDEATANARKYQGAADAAQGAPTGPSAVGAWKPGALGSTSRVDTYLAQANASQNALGARGNASAGVGARPGQSGSGGGNLAGYSSSDVSNFDPSAFGKEYATGAYGEFQKNLGSSLNDLERQSAGTGRLKTGFYTGDQGKTIERLGGDFNNKLAEAATQFSGQRLAALQGGASLRLQAGADQNSYDLGTGQQALERQGQQNSYDIAGANLNEERYRANLGAAQGADQLAYERSTGRDRLTLEQAQFQDTTNARARQSGLDAALSRESMYNRGRETAADRADSFTSSNRSWASAERERSDALAETARLRKLKYGDTSGAQAYGGGTHQVVSNPYAGTALEGYWKG